jgi:spoIIIJ-associated protein
MEELKTIIENLISKMGFEDFSVNFDSDSNRFTLFINDGKFLEKSLPYFIQDFNFVIKLITKKLNMRPVIIDINNYRKKREDLILELARSAARKVVATREEISLPPMNAFERRLIHTELSKRPDLKTESLGEGKERYVVIKPI